MKTVCKNCLVDYSPQWRKIKTLIYCNGCAIHFKRKNVHKIIKHNHSKYLIDTVTENHNAINLLYLKNN